jgi:hypothetical protein
MSKWPALLCATAALAGCSALPGHSGERRQAVAAPINSPYLPVPRNP